MKLVLPLFSSLCFWAVLLFFPSCAGLKNTSNKHEENGHPIDYDKSITEKYWKLTEVMGETIIVSDAGEPYLILKADGHINGYSSCNRLSGTYELKGQNGIAFSQTATTDKVCPDMETENSLLKVLQSATGYRLNKDTLVLNADKKRFLAKFEVVYLR